MRLKERHHGKMTDEEILKMIEKYDTTNKLTWTKTKRDARSRCWRRTKSSKHSMTTKKQRKRKRPHPSR